MLSALEWFSHVSRAFLNLKSHTSLGTRQIQDERVQHSLPKSLADPEIDRDNKNKVREDSPEPNNSIHFLESALVAFTFGRCHTSSLDDSSASSHLSTREDEELLVPDSHF